MGSTTRVIISLIGIAILLIIFPIIMTGAHTLQTDEVTTTTDNVSTAAGVTSANVTLGYDLWQAEIDSVTSISSNITESATATSYVQSTKQLTVGSLSANTTRTLSVLYETDGLTEWTGLGAIVAIAPLLIFIGLLALCIGNIYLGVRQR